MSTDAVLWSAIDAGDVRKVAGLTKPVTHIRAKPCCIYCGAPDVDGFFEVVTDRMTGNDVVICDECRRP